MIEQLKARCRRTFHCLYELLPWRLIQWDKDGHCGIELTREYRTVAIGCSCGITFWSHNTEDAAGLHDPAWRKVRNRRRR